MLYLDTSAAVKLVVAEAESTALAKFLADADEPLATSRVGIVELRRIGRRVSAKRSDRVDLLAASMEVIELDTAVESIAVDLEPELRALDALHLASAMRIEGALTAFVCYDTRLATAATNAGLSVVAPGADESA